MEFVVAATTARRERWRSRENAHSWMSKRIPWELWDPRVVRKLSVSCRYPHYLLGIITAPAHRVDNMQEHGLADTPDSGVAIKGDHLQVALSYPDVQPHFDVAQVEQDIAQHPRAFHMGRRGLAGAAIRPGYACHV
ncbi:AB hydrolase-1 domain-containing protein [Mycena sanguinolenta]|uniref:AB hydrolase-1 domain-containing protein n=1 Tax=Mycena sanguinolenta TaxID=230812 RepID=A0A8H7DK93_9AGAR|nr:AB hydrolase-1 domain-containing protein [Mycena sanguinolenta]